MKLFQQHWKTNNTEILENTPQIGLLKFDNNILYSTQDSIQFIQNLLVKERTNRIQINIT